MAHDCGIDYECFHTGVSQGFFTIKQPGQHNHVWVTEGTWLPAGEKAPETSKKYTTPVIEDKDAPPVLQRRSDKADSDSSSDKKAEKGKDKKDEQKPPTPPTTREATKPPGASETKTETQTKTGKTSTSSPDEPIEDPNRPRLRRGKPDSTAHREPFVTFDPLTDTAPAIDSSGAGKPDAN